MRMETTTNRPLTVRRRYLKVSSSFTSAISAIKVSVWRGFAYVAIIKFLL